MPDAPATKVATKHDLSNAVIDKLREIAKEVQAYGDKCVEEEEALEDRQAEAEETKREADALMDEVVTFREFVLDCNRGIRTWEELAKAVEEELV